MQRRLLLPLAATAATFVLAACDTTPRAPAPETAPPPPGEGTMEDPQASELPPPSGEPMGESQQSDERFPPPPS